MTLLVPPNIIVKLKEYFSGLSTRSYLVGGYLRDSLLSRTPRRDVDIALAGDSQSVGRDLARVLGGSFVPISADHGIGRVVVKDTWAGRFNVDLITLPGSIEEEMTRRDFTIDAMAIPLADWVAGTPGELVIDPFNGRQDLAKKVIRAVNPHVFRDDPGRLLRAVRLAAALRFRIEPETARQVLSDASHISRISHERVRDEFLAILAQDGAKGSLEVLDRLDLLCRVVPELAAAKGVVQSQIHYWDVWEHLMHSVESAERITMGHQHSPIYTLVYWTANTDSYFSQQVGDGHSRRTLLKLAALFHDIAKPQTKQTDETGRTSFPAHSEAGAVVASQRLTQLRISSRFTTMVSKMVEHHLRPPHMMQGVELPTHRAIYRYYRDLKNVAIDTLYLCQADYLATKGPEIDPEAWATHARMVTHVLQVGSQPVASGRAPRLVDGNELMQHFDVGPGPLIGFMLNRVEEARTAGEINTKEEALALATDELAERRVDISL